MKKSPKQLVNDQFGSRAKLVDEILNLLGSDKDDRTSARLKATKNSQLVRLHEVLTTVKSEFGSKDKLVEAIASAKFAPNKPDADYSKKISGYTQKRLLDLHRQVKS
jgi:hypothetical protein